ncbi:hypothetical protein F5148DRAFT_255942 [Russula earlei]|uniref:Uncharacterized protein n=1 Tax=Russula earlei TaxID=71964 RepID=A0ACC0U353_9AGAM|nr:hypothetical protein F5148DRAFT_255942 [Russula earlei]
MRYLTKICDQLVALLSPSHSSGIVWHDQDSGPESINVESDDDSDGLFMVNGGEISEQENVVARPGFQINSPYIVPPEHSPNCPVDPAVLAPHLLPGETTQALINTTYIPHLSPSEAFDHVSFSEASFRQLLMDNTVGLSEDLDEDTMQALIELAFGELYPGPCNKWRAANRHIHVRYQEELTKRKDMVRQEIARGEDSLRRVLREVVVEDVMILFPSLERDNLSTTVADTADLDAGSMQLSDLDSLYPDFRTVYSKYFDDARFNTALGLDPRFESLKVRLISVLYLVEKNQHMTTESRAELIEAVLLEGNFRRAQRALSRTVEEKRLGSIARSPLSTAAGSEDLEKEMRTLAARYPDTQFLLMLKSRRNETLRPVIEEVEALAHTQLTSSIDAVVKAMVHAVLATHQVYRERSVQHEIESEERTSCAKLLVEFIQDINSLAAGRHDSVVYIDNITTIPSIRSRDGALKSEGPSSGAAQYVITGRHQVLFEASLEIWVHPLGLDAGDEYNMQLHSDYIPSPLVNDRPSSRFRIPLTANIVFYRVLETERLLLILLNRQKFYIYLERLPEMNAAIRQGRSVKALSCEKLGDEVLFAFDETKRSLAVCSSTMLRLYVFIFDEGYKVLHGQGNPINLAPWYSQTGTSILHAAFVCGNEEVVLVDSSAQARVISFVIQQFRPASLQLPSLPSSIFSSPDGSCLLVHFQDPRPVLIAYHWKTFGTTAGISLDVPDFSLQGAVLTSMVSRRRIFFMGLDIDLGSVKSIAIDNRNASNHRNRHALHTSLLDCHSEVWSRFPVIAAVTRRTVTSSSERQPKSITFVTGNHSQPFGSYFSDLIQTFERTTRKPTGDELRRIQVSAMKFSSFRTEIIMRYDWDVSRYRVGEWLVDLLCLIPIHIAVCRGNDFVPLSDGVLSLELERSLRGAEISEVVDKLSFGWYEPIFRSYSATKQPVKVVSSMGQPSMGKSFALNHLLDTSFAVGAMRTTEGVWMSVTPTDDALIVGLDCEGVDSVEQSIQTDTLLVLFNTAISNLVLLRNNFTYGHDISGLFQSFQYSASVFDPVANPSLFQSTLFIIIKDVLESDRTEIAREFSSKVRKFIEQEKNDNFISRLHGGKMKIIPSPVIESTEFYKLFPALKKSLDLQKTTHSTAGEFLLTIKTMMAKLRGCDWEPLSQTLTVHRIRALLALLPIALATGYSEPDCEPLKDLETGTIVEADDTLARFAISGDDRVSQADIEMHLTILRESWDGWASRQSISDSDWMSTLASYISGMIELRVNHVQRWLDSNLERFQAGHAAVEDLLSRFDNMVFDMRRTAQMCRAQCASCHLFCILSRSHEGEHSCETNHKCDHKCAFCNDEPKPCGNPAGHPGEHICVVNAHLCGGPCKLSGKRGCLQDCTKVTGHVEDEHMCSALVHMCGEPCALQEMKLPGGKMYSCKQECTVPSDQAHDVHSCDTRLCPMTCELCRRLCVQPHLHGLATGSFHLCGEAHACSALCSAPGICQIDTTPLSIEATFTGRHETFQYTKYSQAAKRLQCVKIIEPGETTHAGSHIHSKEKYPFHFCEARCEGCAFFCSLPFGTTSIMNSYTSLSPLSITLRSSSARA